MFFSHIFSLRYNKLFAYFKKLCHAVQKYAVLFNLVLSVSLSLSHYLIRQKSRRYCGVQRFDFALHRNPEKSVGSARHLIRQAISLISYEERHPVKGILCRRDRRRPDVLRTPQRLTVSAPPRSGQVIALTNGTLNMAPIVDLTTFGLYGSHEPFPISTAVTPCLPLRF